jgi:integrase
MRRTSASLALHSGASLPVVSAQLGHANVRITAQAYAHVLDDLSLDSYSAALDDTSVREKVRGSEDASKNRSTKRHKPT